MRTLKTLALFLILLLAAVACAGETPESTADQGGGSADTETTEAPTGGEAETVGSMVLGTGVDAAYASIVAGVREGIFAKHGVDADLRVYPSGQESLEATVTGESDFSGNGQYNVPFLAAQGANVKIISEYERSDEQFGAVALEGINSPEDLVGTTVATQFGTSPDYYFRLYAEHYGIDIEEIDYIDLQFAQLIPAMANGDIDVFFAFEPLVSNALDTVSGSEVLHRSGEDGVMPLRVYSVVSEKVHTDPELATAFLRGLAEAGQWTNDNREQAATYIAEEFEMDADDAARFVEYFDYSVQFNDESIEELERVTEYVAERGLVDEKPDVQEFIDSSFWEQASE